MAHRELTIVVKFTKVTESPTSAMGYVLSLEWYAGLFSYKTLWLPDGSDGDDLWVRQSTDLTGFDLNTIRWDLGVDNGYKLFINGTLASNGNAEGYTYRWEYSGLFATSLVHSGVNIVAVALEDHGGLTAFDMQVHGTAVPTPSALIGILGMSVIGLVYRGARRRS